MSKFRKRITKLHHGHLQNALVVGKGFGFLENIFEMYQSVFLINEHKPELKSRNLVFKENADDLHLLVDVSTIFFDKEKINLISDYAPVFTRWKSIIIIEGDDPISRDFSQSLYHNGWKCTGLHGFFHLWELK